MTVSRFAAYLAAVEARAEAATPGPWFWDSYSRVFTAALLGWGDDDPDWYEMRHGSERCPHPGPGVTLANTVDLVKRKMLHDYWMCYFLAAIAYQRDPQIASVPALSGDTAAYRRKDDAVFIAAARTDLPRLARALRQTIEALEVIAEEDELVRASEGAFALQAYQRRRGVAQHALATLENEGA